MSSIAPQLVAALPAYRATIEAEEAAGLRQLLEAPANDLIPASEAIPKPLAHARVSFPSGGECRAVAVPRQTSPLLP